MTVVGAAYIDVKPNTKGFQAEAESGILTATRGVASKVVGILATIGAGAAIGGFFTKAISGASDLAETLSKVGVVFGESQSQVTAFANQMAKDFGTPKGAILDAAASIGLIGKASGLSQPAAAKMSTELAKLAVDASSFYNVPLPEALQAIQSGLVGEAEPMRRFGVLLNEQAVSAEAARLGLEQVNGEYTEGAKAQARASLIMKGMTDASGDLERTQGSLSNRLRELRGRAENFATSIGTKVVPIVLRLLDVMESAGARIGPAFASLRTAIAPVVELVTFALAGFQSAFSGEGISSTGLVGVFERIGVAARVLVDFIRQRMVPAITEGLIGAFNSLVNTVRPVAEQVGAFFTTLVTGFTADKASPIERLALTLRNVLFPAIEQVALFLRDSLIPIVTNLGPVFIAAAAAVATFQAALFAINIAEFAVTMSTAIVSAGGLGAALAAAIGPVTLIAVALAALVGGVVVAYQRFEGFRQVVDAVAAFMLDTVWPKVQQFATFIVEQFGVLAGWVREHWSAIQEAISHVVNVVQANIEQFIGVVQGAWRTFGDELVNIASAVWDQIRNIIDTAVAIISGVIVAGLALINGEWGAAWDAIKGVLAAAWDFIVETILNSMRLAREAVEAGVSAIVAAVGDVPGQVRGALGDLGDLLYGAGRAIISGLLRGIQDQVSMVYDFVAGIAGKIADLKGPLDKDRRLLVPAGVAIMRGLEEGIASQEAALAARLGRITSTISSIGGTGGLTVNGAGGGSTALSISGPLVVVQGPLAPGQEAQVGSAVRQAVIGLVRDGTVGREMSQRAKSIQRGR